METEREKRQTMYEENQSQETTPVVLEDAPPSYDELLENVKKLTEENRSLELRASFNYNKYCDLLSQKNTLEEYLDANWEDLDSHAEEIAGIFDIETEKSIDITVRVDYSITVTVPRHKVEEISEDDFEFDVSSTTLEIDDSSAWVRSVDF